MRLYHKQQGGGLLSMLLNLFAIGVIVYGSFLLGPVYYEHYVIKKTLNSLQGRNSITANSTSVVVLQKVREYFEGELRSANVKNFPLDRISVLNFSNGYEIRVKYSVERPVIANVEVHLSFNDTITVPMKT